MGEWERRFAGVDTVPQSKRSEVMSRVRSKDSKPEMIVRRLAFGLGYRYRLYDGRLPGRPDLVFAGRRRIIFVHGCFWHRLPKSKLDFWSKMPFQNRGRSSKSTEASFYRTANPNSMGAVRSRGPKDNSAKTDQELVQPPDAWPGLGPSGRVETRFCAYIRLRVKEQ